MHNEKIVEAIKSTNKLNKIQAKVLEILYKTSINGESDVTHTFLSSKCNNASKQYISKTLKELKDKNFIKFDKSSKNQVFILNTESLELLLKSYELKSTIS
jgi:hypothetical protein